MSDTPLAAQPDGNATAARVLYALALVTCLMGIAAFAAVLASVPAVPLVLGPLVIADVAVFVAIAASLACPVLLIAARVVRPDTQRSTAARYAHGFVSVLCTLTALAILAPAALFSVIDEPYFAEPAGPYGDRVLVIEHHFLLGSSGDIYYVPAGLPFALKQGSFSCDDAYSPMRAGSYSLSWSDRTAALSVWSDTAADPMVPWNGKVGPGW